MAGKGMIKYAPSHPVQIFIAGDYDAACDICAKYCDDVGFCVTVTRTIYVYTGGREDGVIVGLINYPRFPATQTEIMNHAGQLAALLCTGLDQQSYSIQNADQTVWVSHRPEDN